MLIGMLGQNRADKNSPTAVNVPQSANSHTGSLLPAPGDIPAVSVGNGEALRPLSASFGNDGNDMSKCAS